MTHPNDNPSKLWFVCEACGADFWRWRADAKRRPPRFCSAACRARPRPLVPHPTDQGAMLVPLADGAFTVIDAADAEAVGRYKWSRDKTRWTSYAHATVDGRTVRLHRFLLGDPPGVEVDHWDRDGLNNRRSNLRAASSSQNGANQPVRTRGYKGVYRSGRRWQAKIGEEAQFLGSFDAPEEAARAYDAAARDRFGAFARLNFPGDAERAA